MIRLLSIEWAKLKHYKAFKVIASLYFLVLVGVCCSVHFLFLYLESKGADFQGIKPSIIPFYQFPDVWQNLAYLGSFLKIIAAFLVIISVSNEFSYKTFRQNLLDGLSRTEFFLSKQSLIFMLSFLHTFIIFICGLFMGLAYTPAIFRNEMFQQFSFLPAHFMQVYFYLNIAMLLALWLKKAGIAIILLALYSLFIEPILGVILSYQMDSDVVRDLLPIRAFENLVPLPFKKYIFFQTTNHVSWTTWLTAWGWGALLLWANHRIVQRKNA